MQVTIQFARTENAALANAKSVDYDLGRLIQQFPNTTLGPGVRIWIPFN